MKKILFISHEASRTGGPFVLLHLLKWLKHHFQGSYEIDVLLIKGGDLEPDFRSVANNLYFWNKKASFSRKIIKKMLPGFLRFPPKAKKIIRNNQYDLIYVNSIAAFKYAVELKRELHVPLVLHLHELLINVRTYCPDFETMHASADAIICVSESVKVMATNHYQVPEEKLNVVYEFVNFDLIDEKISASLGESKVSSLSERRFTICASGTLNWRKNPDSFLQVAIVLAKKFPDFDIQFCWIGAGNIKEKSKFEEDIKKANLSNRFSIISNVENPFEFFAACDLFLMTSKEDPFPLVCIEAGYIGKPIICFDKAGGIPEMLATGGGKVVEYLDAEAMAMEVVNYYQNRRILIDDGTYLKNFVKRYDVNLQAPKIRDIVDHCIRASD